MAIKTFLAGRIRKTFNSRDEGLIEEEKIKDQLKTAKTKESIENIRIALYSWKCLYEYSTISKTFHAIPFRGFARDTQSGLVTQQPRFPQWKFLILSLFRRYRRYSIMRLDSQKPQWADRDYFILSKGHGCPALYVILANLGFFPEGRIESFAPAWRAFEGHPVNKIPGIEARQHTARSGEFLWQRNCDRS